MSNKLLLYNTEIVIEDYSFQLLLNFIQSIRPTTVFILVDSNTKKHCLPILIHNVPILKKSYVFELPPGESMKSLKSVEDICSFLLQHNVDRNSLLINLGGGCICDVGGFVASIIKRGIKFINIPTTLMAQVDAAIGGKVGINFDNNKNQIGVFKNPDFVFVFPSYTHTLSSDHFLFAQAEILKYGLIYDELFWIKVKSHKHNIKSILSQVILKCIKIKLAIVKSDYHDYNKRRKLNFGHSIAHAIESVFLLKKQNVSHGQALSCGLICETFISYKMFKFSDDILNDIVETLLDFFPHLQLAESYDTLLLKYLKNDKKNIQDVYNFTLIKGIGESIVNCKVKDKIIIDSLNYYRKICQI